MPLLGTVLLLEFVQPFALPLTKFPSRKDWFSIRTVKLLDRNGKYSISWSIYFSPVRKHVWSEVPGGFLSWLQATRYTVIERILMPWNTSIRAGKCSLEVST